MVIHNLFLSQTDEIDRIEKLVFSRGGSDTPEFENELEFRIGYYDNGKFVSGVHEHEFNEMKQYLYNSKQYTEYIPTYTEHVFSKGKFRSIVNKNGDIKYQTKLKIGDYTTPFIVGYNINNNQYRSDEVAIRIAKAGEKWITKEEYEQNKEKEVMMERERTTFIFPNFQLDFTTRKIYGTYQYEVECELRQEFLKGLLRNKVISNFFVEFKYALGLLYPRVHSIGNKGVLQPVIYTINGLFKRLPKELQPASLQREDVETGLEHFAITNKLDGVGYYQYCIKQVSDGIEYIYCILSNKRDIWVIHRLKTSSIKSEDAEVLLNTISKCEVVEKKEINEFYFFDVLVYKGQSVTVDLDERIKYYNKISQLCTQYFSLKGKMEYKSKEFISLDNPLESMQYLLQKMQQQYGQKVVDFNDGIIFQPAGNLQDRRTLKWKFQSKITIDFLLRDKKQIENDVVYTLYTQYKRGEYKPFVDNLSILKSLPKSRQYHTIRFNMNELFDGLNTEELEDMVLETSYENGNWIPHRIRFDKLPENTNFEVIAHTTFKDMIYELTLYEVMDTLTKKRRPIVVEPLVKQDKEEIIFTLLATNGHSKNNGWEYTLQFRSPLGKKKYKNFFVENRIQTLVENDKYSNLDNWIIEVVFIPNKEVLMNDEKRNLTTDEPVGTWVLHKVIDKEDSFLSHKEVDTEEEVNEKMGRILREYNIGSNMKEFRLFFNKLKKKWISKYCSAETKVLDIGSGKGGDLPKYISAGVDDIVLVEPSETHRADLNIRLDDSFIKQRLRDVVIIPTGGENTEQIEDRLQEKTVGIADVVSMMFSLTFFFQSQELLCSLVKTIDKCLGNEGIFIFGVLDGETLQTDLLEKGDINNTSVSIKKVNVNKDGIYGQEILFEIQDSQTATLQTEWLVNIEELKHLLAYKGIYLIDQLNPNDENMSTYITDPNQKQLGNYYKFFAFQKQGINYAKFISPLPLRNKQHQPLYDEYWYRMPTPGDGSCLYHSIMFSLLGDDYTPEVARQFRVNVAEMFSIRDYLHIQDGQFSLMQFQQRIQEVNGLHCFTQKRKDENEKSFHELLDSIVSNSKDSNVKELIRTIIMKLSEKGFLQEEIGEFCKGLLIHDYLEISKTLKDCETWADFWVIIYLMNLLKINIVIVHSSNLEVMSIGKEYNPDYISIVIFNINNQHFEAVVRKEHPNTPVYQTTFKFSELSKLM